MHLQQWISGDGVSCTGLTPESVGTCGDDGITVTCAVKEVHFWCVWDCTEIDTIADMLALPVTTFWTMEHHDTNDGWNGCHYTCYQDCSVCEDGCYFQPLDPVECPCDSVDTSGCNLSECTLSMLPNQLCEADRGLPDGE
eukprot:UN28713